MKSHAMLLKLAKAINFGFLDEKDRSSLSTISRARKRIDLSEIFYHLVSEAKRLGLSKGFILAVDSTQFEAYLKGDKDARIGYCAAKKERIFGYKARIICDAESELPVAVVVTPANDRDPKQFLPLMKRVFRNFTYEIKNCLRIRNCLRIPATMLHT
ncbi:MAG: transposase [Candidatus Bilamarchaeaceae archaeon]